MTGCRVMGMEFTIDTKFNKEQAGTDIKKRAVKLLYEVMNNIRTEAKRIVPVDTGRLKNSIHLEPTRPANKISCVAGTNYAEHVEFGTSKQKAQPYMRPAKDIVLRRDLGKLARKYKIPVKTK